MGLFGDVGCRRRSVLSSRVCKMIFLTLLFFSFNRNMNIERGLLSFIFDRPVVQFIYEGLDKGSILPLYLLIFKIMIGLPYQPKDDQSVSLKISL